MKEPVLIQHDDDVEGMYLLRLGICMFKRFLKINIYLKFTIAPHLKNTIKRKVLLPALMTKCEYISGNHLWQSLYNS